MVVELADGQGCIVGVQFKLGDDGDVESNDGDVDVLIGVVARLGPLRGGGICSAPRLANPIAACVPKPSFATVEGVSWRRWSCLRDEAVRCGGGQMPESSLGLDSSYWSWILLLWGLLQVIPQVHSASTPSFPWVLLSLLGLLVCPCA